MLTQKTFHLQMPWHKARAMLSDIRGYRRKCLYVEDMLTPAKGVVRLLFSLPLRFRGHVDLAIVEGENPTQLLFRSEGGAIQLIGLLEYFEVKPNLTEIVLTVDYVISSRFYRWANYCSRSVDRFLNQNVALLESHFSQPVGDGTEAH